MSEFEGEISVLLAGFPIYKDYARSEKLSYEFLEKFHSNGELRYLISGSFREGYPDVMYSDIDMMQMLNPRDEILSQETQIQVFYPVEKAPAHVKFVVPRAYCGEFKEKYHTISTFLGLFETDKDGCFISAESARRLNRRDFLPEFMAGQKPSAPWADSATADETVLSPAYTLRTTNKTLAIQRSLYTDRVPAIECMGWPNSAHEWINRRPRYWPNADLVENISTGGFMIVPKPSDVSGDIGREWRISFSKPEAELFESFNECQAKVYYMLRSLYIRYLKEKLLGALTSYHIKTVMFWMLEEREPGFWLKENIADIFLSALKDLLKFTKEGTCPHYFIRNHNLFYKTSKQELEATAREIALVLNDPAAAFDSVVNQAFLGLMPRLGLLSVEVKNKLNMKMLSLSKSMAYEAFTNPQVNEFVRNLELQCLSKTLEETATASKLVPDSVALLEVYLPAILQGHQLASAMGTSEAEFNRKKLNLVEQDFLEMDIGQGNQSLLVWLELGKIAVDDILRGNRNKVFLFIQKFFTFVYEAVERLQVGRPTKEDKTTLNTVRAVCSTAGAFLATAKFSGKDITYLHLHEALCEVLPQYEDNVENPRDVMDPIIMLFVLGGATCKMAKTYI